MPTASNPAGLLDIERLDRTEIEAILERAKFFQPLPKETYRRLDTLKGKTVINLFFEASTRTRVSFEIAARRLGAETLTIAAQGSSASKGESLVDTLNTLAAMRPHAIVMRRPARRSFWHDICRFRL
jgi:aspartate carbamoyltransferase catalytic subunit